MALSGTPKDENGSPLLKGCRGMSRQHDRETPPRVQRAVAPYKEIFIGGMMKATQLLHNLGQSIWLDNITRDLLNSGTLKLYIDELSVTGLTSNPTIFDHAIKNSTAYDAAISSPRPCKRSGRASVPLSPTSSPAWSCSNRSTTSPSP